MDKTCVLCWNKVKKYRSDICGSCMVLIRRLRLKLACIKLLHGKCFKCGMIATLKNLGAFQFHHKDPSEKKFQLSFGTYSWDKIKEEARKCELWCANCHSINHATTYTEEKINRAIRFCGTEDIHNLVAEWKIIGS